MPKLVKWILAGLAAIVVLVIAAMIIAIAVVDVNQYKPQIVEQVAKATGRPFSLGGDLKLSVFPWIGVSLSDAHLGNPPEFKEKDMAAVDFFEVRVKVLPLLAGNVEIKRFVLKGAKITIVKLKDGRLNLEGIPPAKEKETTGKPAPTAEATRPSEGKLPITGLKVGEFIISDGSLVFIDMGTNLRKEIQQISLTLENLSLDKPIGLKFSALADNRPVSLVGTLGPVGPTPGKSPVAFNLELALAKIIQSQLKGRVDPSGTTPQFNLSLTVPLFSARQLLTELGQAMPFEPSDSEVLKKISLSMTLDGSPEAVAIKDGRLTLDDSQLSFAAQAKDFTKPDLTFTATLDRIDVDRYLPPPPKTPATEPQAKAPQAEETAPVMDYAPLRKLVLDSRIKVGELKAKNVRTANIEIHATAKNGIIRIDPVGMDLYKGKIQIDGTFNVQGATPQNAINLNISSVQAGPLLKDFINKDLIEGALEAALKLTFNGDQPGQIRKTLNGGGELTFNDGAIVGIDLANMARNVQAAFGGQGQPQQKPRTDFSEFLVPLTLKNGLANIDGTKLSSPLLRLSAGGNAHLAKETLDLRVEPKFVGTLVGQGDAVAQRSGVMVPILITGTFAKPKFAPDLKSLLSTSIPGNEKVTQDLEQTKKKVTEDLQKKTQDLFKSLPFGGSKK